MHKIIIILLTIFLLSATLIHAQADEPKIDNNLTVEDESASENLTVKSRLDKLAKPYDDVKISNGISAGVMSEREDNIMESRHRTPVKEKGQEVGVGISLSF